jgi:hypothetical protein
MSNFITERILDYTGICQSCKKADSVSDEGFCAKCLAQLDQMCADSGMDEEIPE